MLTPRALLLGIIAAVVLLGVVVAAREAGPIPIDDRYLLDDTFDTVPPAPDRPPATQQARASESLLSKVSMWYVIITLTAVALVFVLAIRALIGRDDARDDEERKPPPHVWGAGEGAATTERLQRGVRQAEERLLSAQPGDVGGAVIAAWLQLERAATDVGSARPPAATPTEFTVGLLKRHRADAAAMAVLLGLYHQARFGNRPLPPSAADDALTAVRTIATGLGATRIGASAP